MSIQGTVVPHETAPRPIDPGVTIGHVHLRTADIDRVREFYVGVLGFDVVFEARDVPGWGTTGDILFLAAGGYHHHLGFNTWKSAGGGPQPDGVAGLHHVALRYPSRAAPAPSTGRCGRRPTTGRISRSTSPTPTATTSSSAGTVRSRSGRATRTAICRGSRSTSTSATCSWRRPGRLSSPYS